MVDEEKQQQGAGEGGAVCAWRTRILIKNNSHASGTLPKTHPPHPRSILRQLREARPALRAVDWK